MPTGTLLTSSPTSRLRGRICHSDLDNIFLSLDDQSLGLLADEDTAALWAVTARLAEFCAGFIDGYSPLPLVDALPLRDFVDEPDRQRLRGQLESLYLGIFDPSVRLAQLKHTSDVFGEALAAWQIARARGLPTSQAYQQLREKAHALRNLLGQLPRERWIP